MPQANLRLHLQSVHGVRIMIVAILVAYYSLSTVTFQPRQEHFLFGCFINDTLFAVKGVSPNRYTTYFEVLHNNRSQPYAFDDNYLQHV